ncbi:MAG: sporulation domain-containing protein [Comamonadaceae bacterium]|nr:MAG: sporulation domain-containing protein [Comamonadaceae bacterium]
MCAGLMASAQAQVLDDVVLHQEGANAIVQIKLVTPVQYSRSISARASDLVQAFYTVLPTRTQITLESSERRIKGGGSIPDIIIRDESATNTSQTSTSRKLVIRFAAPVRFKVRAGHNSSIELVLEGLSESVKTAQAANAKVVPVRPAPTASPAPVASTKPAVQDTEATAATLLATAQSAFDGGDYNAATESLNQLLSLPPNASSRKAQELAGLARLNAGDKARAASEFDLFLKLYPEGLDSDRIRQLVTTLPAIGSAEPSEDKKASQVTTTTTGSVSMFYYGGKSNTRTQEFQDSPLGGLPVLQSDTNLSNTDQRQLQSRVDLNWRYRDAEKDMRFVVRDSLTRDYLKNSDKERLNALYFDYRSLVLGGNVRVGRQSPNGGGVMYRFDGVQAGYTFAPKWKVNAVIGKPSDPLLDTRRTFYGMSVDAEALTKELSGSAYVIEQVIDGQTDRRGLGTDLRYFRGGVSASGQFDYEMPCLTAAPPPCWCWATCCFFKTPTWRCRPSAFRNCWVQHRLKHCVSRSRASRLTKTSFVLAAPPC